jgi:hypothetical protein
MSGVKRVGEQRRQAPVPAAQSLNSQELGGVLDLNQTRPKGPELLSKPATHFVRGEVGERLLEEFVALAREGEVRRMFRLTQGDSLGSPGTSQRDRENCQRGYGLPSSPAR